MGTFAEQRYSKLGPKLVKALKARFFDAWYFDEPAEAVDTVVSLIPREHVVSWGGSMTLVDLGVQDRLAREGFTLLDRDKATSQEERAEIMRKSMICDTYLAGTNAISEDGQLVNIDGFGNRVAAMIYGPRQVIIVAGMNKVAKTLFDAVARARNVAAPTNVQRLVAGSPMASPSCSETGTCVDCVSGNSICNYFVTIRSCRPAGRIKVVLVGKDLGL